jgi:hypothetical protein
MWPSAFFSAGRQINIRLGGDGRRDDRGQFSGVFGLLVSDPFLTNSDIGSILNMV